MSKKKRKTRKRKKASESCPHCKGGEQSYRYLKMYRFDVDRAREMVLDGREAVELERDDIEYCLDGCRIHQQHLDHVDTKFPGIMAHCWYPMPDGTVAHGHVLIDGNHRAARCLRDKLPYFVHLLSEEESFEVTFEAPNITEILEKNRVRQTESAC